MSHAEEMDTPEGDGLDTVVTVEAYEAKHYPMVGENRVPRFRIVWKPEYDP